VGCVSARRSLPHSVTGGPQRGRCCFPASAAVWDWGRAEGPGRQQRGRRQGQDRGHVEAVPRCRITSWCTGAKLLLEGECPEWVQRRAAVSAVAAPAYSQGALRLTTCTSVCATVCTAVVVTMRMSSPRLALCQQAAPRRQGQNRVVQIASQVGMVNLQLC
jgi:hypothetical protein